MAPEGVPFFEVALSSFPSNWSGVKLRQFCGRMVVVVVIVVVALYVSVRWGGVGGGLYQEHVSASPYAWCRGQEAFCHKNWASLHRLLKMCSMLLYATASDKQNDSA